MNAADHQPRVHVLFHARPWSRSYRGATLGRRTSDEYVLCNAGGVIVSYFEWAQNRAAVAWTLDEINQRLRRQILAAADAVWARSANDGIEPRLAAQSIAVERVAEATRLRGLYP